MAACIGLGLVLVGCGSTPSSGSGPLAASLSPSSAPGPSAAASAGPSAPSSPLEPARSAPASPSTSPGPIAVDPSLLDLLPATIGGVALSEDPDTAAEIATDPALGATVAALDVGTAFGPLASDGVAADYAVATVARLRGGMYSDALFRAWRDSFERGVCERAGGVSPGASEFQLGGRTVYRSTCAGGVTMYQAYLDSSGVLVSIQGSGPADLGRAIAGSLKE